MENIKLTLFVARATFIGSDGEKEYLANVDIHVIADNFSDAEKMILSKSKFAQNKKFKIVNLKVPPQPELLF